MNETDKALAQLAEKLGVTAQYLWAALLKQQLIEGINLTIFVITATIALLAAARFGYRKFKEDDYDSGPWILVPIGSLVAEAIILFVGGYWALTCLLNPQFAALYDVMGAVK